MTKEFFIKQLPKILNGFQYLKSTAKYEDLSDIASDNIEDLTVLLTKG